MSCPGKPVKSLGFLFSPSELHSGCLSPSTTPVKSLDAGDAPHTISACLRFSHCWLPPQSVIGPFDKKGASAPTLFAVFCQLFPGVTMNYPFWNIPHLGSGWVIGMIAIFHVV